jgi:hypothetical protein
VRSCGGPCAKGLWKTGSWHNRPDNIQANGGALRKRETATSFVKPLQARNSLFFLRCAVEIVFLLASLEELFKFLGQV